MFLKLKKYENLHVMFFRKEVITEENCICIFLNILNMLERKQKKKGNVIICGQFWF